MSRSSLRSTSPSSSPQFPNLAAPPDPPRSPGSRTSSTSTRQRLLSTLNFVRPNEITSSDEDTVVDSGRPATYLRPESHVAASSMRKFTKETTTLLHEFPVSGKMKVLSAKYIETGSFCVVRKALRQAGKEEDVAMKALRKGLSEESDAMMFRHETNIWRQLQHRNILPFYGTFIHEDHIYMVSPWAHGGQLIHYLSKNPQANRQELLVQIVEALRYLHDECNIVHGDIKGDNILVSSDGQALVRDFELATHLQQLPTTAEPDPALRMAMTLRWSAPELLGASDVVNAAPPVHPVRSQVTSVDTNLPVQDLFIQAPNEHQSNRRANSESLPFPHVNFPSTHGHEGIPVHHANFSTTHGDRHSIHSFESQSSLVHEGISTDPTENRASPTIDADKIPPVHGVKARATDVYAFGMVILEVYTLEPPWGNMYPGEILVQVLAGRKPPKPEGEAIARGFTPSLWRLVRKCLDADPSKRPSMADLISYISKGYMFIDGADLSKDIIAESAISGDTESLLWPAKLKGKEAEKVVLRVPRNAHRLEGPGKEAFLREIQTLTVIRHPNILQIYGTAEIESRMFFVTPWMENGSITTYLRANPQANRFNLLRQAAEALMYLHSGPVESIGPIIHGSLYPECIMVSSNGNAKLTDFGLSNILYDLGVPILADPRTIDPAVRFHPPEHFSIDHRATVKDDVYSLAMVVFRVLTGKDPFANITYPFSIIRKIVDNEIPERPYAPETAIDQMTWNLLTDCWNPRPEDRPRMEQLHKGLSLFLP